MTGLQPEERLARLASQLPTEIANWILLDDEYRAELIELADSDRERLHGLFDGRIAFGTAGLRAPMGPGPKAMNRLVVGQTTAGLMDWLADRGSQPKLVIGHDARHRSAQYAAAAAKVARARGAVVELIDRPAPTPVLALSVLARHADAGIMITASHNPAVDNGYKLYLGDGIQLVSPADTEIAACIDAVVAAIDPAVPADRRWVGGGGGPPGPAPVDIADEMLTAHRHAAVEALRTGHREIQVLYTAMHGVGGRHLLDCFDAAGFPPPEVVSEQFDPNPEFPTAPFPNPEEAGALDLAFDTARRLADEGRPRDVILANDPDADRLAVAIEDADGWRRLTGDEVGALLADHLIGIDQPTSDGAAPPMVASSIVSSRLIEAIAADAGVTSLRTLTGFKWLARPIVERPERRYLFGYEEALGYCIDDRVRDKDGITAAVVMAELAAQCAAEGTTLGQRLDGLAERHGLYATRQVTVRLDELAEHERRDALDRAANAAPDELAGVAVAERVDLSNGWGDLPPTDGTVFDLADGSRVVIRPSGTEPKIKAYLEVVEPAGSFENAEEARHRAGLRLEYFAAAVTELLTQR